MFTRVIRVLALAILLLAPSVASAVTLEQILALSKAGVSEPIILALIDRDKTVFTIEPEQLVSLQKAGLSETLILAMLRSGREEGEAAANAAAAFNTSVIMSTLPLAPEVVIVGHGPDRPNTGNQNGFWSGPPIADIVDAPIFFSSPYYGAPSRGSRRGSRRLLDTPPASFTPVPESPALCIAHVSSGPVPPMVGSRGFVVPCPSPLQPKRR